MPAEKCGQVGFHGGVGKEKGKKTTEQVGRKDTGMVHFGPLLLEEAMPEGEMPTLLIFGAYGPLGGRHHCSGGTNLSQSVLCL